jgi:hypothetical protein
MENRNSEPLLRKLVRWINKLSSVMSLLCLTFYALMASGFKNLPRTPQPVTGRIVPVNNHGGLVYLTVFQHHLLMLSSIVGGSAFVVAFISHFALKKLGHIPASSRSG